MITGVGVDLVAIHRIRQTMKRNPRFLHRIFTAQEREEITRKGASDASIAAGFAAKEAVSKMLGTGIGRVSWHEIELHHDEKGQPAVQLRGKAKTVARQRMIDEIWISISHEREMAVAFVVGQQDVGKGKEPDVDEAL